MGDKLILMGAIIATDSGSSVYDCSCTLMPDADLVVVGPAALLPLSRAR